MDVEVMSSNNNIAGLKFPDEPLKRFSAFDEGTPAHPLPRKLPSSSKNMSSRHI